MACTEHEQRLSTVEANADNLSGCVYALKEDMERNFKDIKQSLESLKLEKAEQAAFIKGMITVIAFLGTLLSLAVYHLLPYLKET